MTATSRQLSLCIQHLVGPLQVIVGSSWYIELKAECMACRMTLVMLHQQNPRDDEMM